MTDCPEYYTRLFNRVSEAIEEMRAKKYDAALKILIDSQFEAEELYLQAGDGAE